MIEAEEKSTAVPVGDGVRLDGRLAIWHEQSQWLALADVHYGYEMSRRSGGGLWPMWGMNTIEERFSALLEDYQPRRVILAGDIVDSAAAGGEAVKWLQTVKENCDELICVAGNHDRGTVRNQVEFVENISCDGFFFHHGHRTPEVPDGMIEVCGHFHPSWSAGDGAGTRLRLPTLIQERSASGSQRWILPAFSPWAGGGQWQSGEGATVKQWACSPQRVFEVEG